MIIAIDGNEANVEKRVGVNRFAFEVLWGIYTTAGKSLKFLIFLSEKPKRDLPPETDWWQYEVFGPKRFWTWTGLVKRLYLGKPKPDVLFSPSHYGPAFSPIPFVISIMDLGFLQQAQQFTKKDFYQLKHWTKRSVKKASKIISISEFTKKDIVKTYGIDSEKVIVAHPGYKRHQALNAKHQTPNIPSDYILFLGTLKPSKNIEGLIKAFKILNTKYSILNTNLVIAGKKGWLYQSIFEKVKKLGLRDRVIFTGFVSDEEKEVLIKRAKAFIMPSFWEGFGIPILEAMAAGTPVVCSDRGALPEVVGDAAILVNPENPEDIANGIYKVLNDESIHRNLVKKGKERIKLFSWGKCSKIILTTLINITNS